MCMIRFPVTVNMTACAVGIVVWGDYVCRLCLCLSDCIRGRMRFFCACATSYLYLREKGHQQLMSKKKRSFSTMTVFLQLFI